MDHIEAFIIIFFLTNLICNGLRTYNHLHAGFNKCVSIMAPLVGTSKKLHCFQYHTEKALLTLSTLCYSDFFLFVF